MGKLAQDVAHLAILIFFVWSFGLIYFNAFADTRMAEVITQDVLRIPAAFFVAVLVAGDAAGILFLLLDWAAED